MGRLHLYRMDMKYVRDLAKVDDHVMSVSPQINKAVRPFVGIVVVNDDHSYCIPLSSPKQKHERMKNGRDFSKIYDRKGRLIGVLNFNSMIPVTPDVIQRVNLRDNPKDDQQNRAFKVLMRNQIDWCNANADAIIQKANKLYAIVTTRPDAYRSLTRRCCDFKRLEETLSKWEDKKKNKTKSKVKDATGGDEIIKTEDGDVEEENPELVGGAVDSTDNAKDGSIENGSTEPSQSGDGDDET